VDENQVITTSNCRSGNMLIRFGSRAANFSNSLTESAMNDLLENTLNTGLVSVTHEFSTQGSVLLDVWRVVFLNSGDVPALSVRSYNSGCQVTVEEFIKGSRNQFTIEPKTAAGTVLRDVTTAQGFAGKDIFLTETFFASNNSWFRDQGVAIYNPQVYEIQQISVGHASLNSAVTVVLKDYLTPGSTSSFTSGSFTGAYTSFEVQQAIESLPNVDNVDVERIVSTNGDVSYLITFLTNLGDVPLMTTSAGGVTITEINSGICEVQTITVAADEEFVREQKNFSGSYNCYFGKNNAF